MFYGTQQRSVGTTIRTLKVRAPETEQQRVQREIALADWPESDPDKIVFIRKLSASSQATDIASALRSEAQRQIREQPADNVQIFENNEAMLAALLNDTARGKLTAYWYWRRWHGLADQTTSRALLSLSTDHSEAFCGAVTRLLKTNTVLPVLNALSEPDVRQLIAELASTMGYSGHLNLQRIIAQQQKTADDRNDTASASVNPRNGSQVAYSAGASTDEQDLADSLFKALLKALSQAPAWSQLLSDQRLPDSHRVLIAFILCRSLAPVALQENAEGTLTAILKECSTRSPIDHSQKPPRHDKNPGYGTRTQAILSESMSSETSEYNDENLHRVNPEHFAQRFTSDNFYKGHSHRGHAQMGDGSPPDNEQQRNLNSPDINADTIRDSVERQHEINATSDGERSNVKSVVDAEPSDLPAQYFSPDAQFNTGFGGIFYLLNFLNREPAQKLMREYCTRIPTGWHWLLGLTDIIPGSENIRHDPMYLFLCDQAGLKPHEHGFRLPEHCTKALERLANDFYGSELWNSALIDLQATVTATPDQVRVSANLKDVRVDVRLAALDVDPGWLPWLGKIVRFCFESDYFPQRYTQTCTSRYSQATDTSAPEKTAREKPGRNNQ